MKKRNKKNADAPVAEATAPDAAPVADDAGDAIDDKTQPNVEAPAFEEGPDTEVGGDTVPRSSAAYSTGRLFPPRAAASPPAAIEQATPTSPWHPTSAPEMEAFSL